MERLLHFFSTLQEDLKIDMAFNKPCLFLTNRNIIILYNTLGKDSGENNQKEVLFYQKKKIHCIQLWDYQLSKLRNI